MAGCSLETGAFQEIAETEEGTRVENYGEADHSGKWRTKNGQSQRPLAGLVTSLESAVQDFEGDKRCQSRQGDHMPYAARQPEERADHRGKRKFSNGPLSPW